jgi:hypothetical protein
LGSPGVIAFERFDEGLCHAVALRTLEWGEAGFEVERQRDLDGFVGRRLNRYRSAIAPSAERG